MQGSLHKIMPIAFTQVIPKCIFECVHILFIWNIMDFPDLKIF